MKHWLLALVLLGVLCGCSGGQRGFPGTEGIANFDQVDEHLYRGAQPNRVGLQYLHKLGVGTIVNLRMPDDVWVAEADEAKSLGITYFNVPMNSIRHMTMENMTNVLSLIERSRGPVFIHCQHGCDRTGAVVACYRIHHDGWTSEKALQEARTYGMYRRELFMKSLVKRFGQSDPLKQSPAPH